MGKPVPCCLLAAIKIFLKPNKMLSVLKFGVRVSLKVTLRGNKPTLWHPHENGVI